MTTEQRLAEEFGGIVTTPEHVIEERFKHIMKGEELVDAEERGMIRCLDIETQKMIRRYIYRGYLAGWIEAVGPKWRALPAKRKKGPISLNAERTSREAIATPGSAVHSFSSWSINSG